MFVIRDKIYMRVYDYTKHIYYLKATRIDFFNKRMVYDFYRLCADKNMNFDGIYYKYIP